MVAVAVSGGMTMAVGAIVGRVAAGGLGRELVWQWCFAERKKIK